MAACATPTARSGDEPRVRQPVQTCNAAPGQNYLGQKASAQTGAAILAATGATRLRWVPPRTAMTMEYAYGRVTVSYGDDFVITRVTCG